MGKLLDLLQAASGESSLRSMLGKWRQAVSESLDSVTDAISSGNLVGPQGPPGLGIQTTEYLQVVQANGNVPVFPNSDIVLDSAVIQQGIAYNSATGVISLKAGKVYSLRAAGTMVNFVGGAPPFFDATWVGAAGNLPLVPSAIGTWRPIIDVNNEAPSNAVEVLYKPVVDIDVKLRTISSGGGSAQIPQGHFWFVVEQVA